jgi:hypothetical protein
MSGTCKEWFDSIGCKSTLDKEQYTHLVWCAALASKVENFTATNNARDEICPTCGGGEWLTIGLRKKKCCSKCFATKPGKLPPVA